MWRDPRVGPFMGRASVDNIFLNGILWVDSHSKLIITNCYQCSSSSLPQEVLSTTEVGTLAAQYPQHFAKCLAQSRWLVNIC